MDEENIAVLQKRYVSVKVENRIIYSEFLERDVIIDVYRPLKMTEPPVSLLLINDGQDLVTMDFASILNHLFDGGNIQPVLCVGIHCSLDRMNEYGTAYRADYKGRGARAGLYTKFILEELLPLLTGEYHVSSSTEKSFAGFSLGGLSALDIVWNHPHIFNKAGVF